MACSATARSFTPCALATRMPAAPSASREYWSVPALIDWMKASLPAAAISSFRHRPEHSSTSTSVMRALKSSRLRTSNQSRPALRRAKRSPMR